LHIYISLLLTIKTQKHFCPVCFRPSIAARSCARVFSQRSKNSGVWNRDHVCRPNYYLGKEGSRYAKKIQLADLCSSGLCSMMRETSEPAATQAGNARTWKQGLTVVTDREALIKCTFFCGTHWIGTVFYSAWRDAECGGPVFTKLAACEF
jgi:hypothetical protein